MKRFDSLGITDSFLIKVNFEVASQENIDETGNLWKYFSFVKWVFSSELILMYFPQINTLAMQTIILKFFCFYEYKASSASDNS